ncbi:MAG: FtsX-like permease family protein [Acetobacteraceae bacterium]
MNPLPMLCADLRAMRVTAVVVVILLALAVAVSVVIQSQERAIRRTTAGAADDFPLLIGAPGSQTQLVLTSVYLRIDALPLMDGVVLNRLSSDSGVAAVAPIAFGDSLAGWPIIGTATPFVTRWGHLKPTEGRVFQAEDEAVIGADVRLALGAMFHPSHGVRVRDLAGVADAHEAEHQHGDSMYRVVGRLPRLGTAWDRAILVPIETVWETHGLGSGHQSDKAPIGPPYDATPVPGVPAVVVKPRSVADAYVLRGIYRQGGTMALFPAEVLVSLYRSMGDIRDVALVIGALNNVVVQLAILLLAVTLVGLRQRRHAVLRALGAPLAYVFLVAWGGLASLILAGGVVGLLLGWVSSHAIAVWFAGSSGFALRVTIGGPEVGFVLIFMAVGCLLAVIPALTACRVEVSAHLRGP